MHSNFITPPDLIETVLVVDASEEDIKSLAEGIKTIGKPYNVYFYNAEMKDYNWLGKVMDRSDIVLMHQDSQVPVLTKVSFGPDAVFNQPLDYFNK